MISRIDLEIVNHFILRKQHLTDDARIDDILQITEDIGGLHATDAVTPYLSLFVRSSSFAKDSLDLELHVRKNLGKIRCMRSTLYILTKDMIPLDYAATSRIVEKNSKGYAEFRGVSSEQYDVLSRSILKLLKGKEMSVFDIKKALKTQTDVPSVLNLMCDQGLLVRGRREKGWRDRTHKYSVFHEYFPDIELKKYSESEAVILLVRQYLKSFGPVTENDIAWWTGFSKTQVREALSNLKRQISRLEIASLSGEFIMLQAEREALINTDPVREQTINLLPTLDPYLMGYKDRERYLDSKNYNWVFDRSGNAVSSILLDGRIIGVWDFERGAEHTVKIFLFEKVKREVLKEIYRKTEETGRFLADNEVKIKECESMPPLTSRPAGAIMSPLKGC